LADGCGVVEHPETTRQQSKSGRDILFDLLDDGSGDNPLLCGLLGELPAGLVHSSLTQQPVVLGLRFSVSTQPNLLRSCC
jgi:hypothetical protein